MSLIALAAEPVEKDKVEETSESELLEFSKFDINRVLKHGERLVGSSGAEYDLPDEDLLGNENLYAIFSIQLIITRVWKPHLEKQIILVSLKQTSFTTSKYLVK